MDSLWILLPVFIGVQWGVYQLLLRARFFQRIYELGPASHQEKTRTPSMGGLGILINICIGAWMLGVDDPAILWVLALTLAFGVIGFYDDLLSLKAKQNKGLSMRAKFLCQCVVGGGFLVVYSMWIQPLSFAQLGFYLFVIAGASNATNLSDGLDGLLSGLSLLTVVGFLVLIYGSLFIAMESFLAGLFGAVFAFLVFNLHPAKLFMGDTGSLSLGAAFAGIAIVLGDPWVLLPLGGVYIVETASVMIQVLSFKMTGRRVFKMAPLHHHFELMGLSESKVVLLFWGMSLGFLGCLLI